MLDLNARMLYKVRFNIAPTEQECDLLWIIVMHVREWQTRKHNRNGQDIIPRQIQKWSALKNGDRIFSEDNSVYIESDLFVDDKRKTYWACRITETAIVSPGYAPRQWVTEIGFEQEDNAEAFLSCVLSYSDWAGFVGAYQDDPEPSIPNIIKRYILRDNRIRVFCGPDDATNEPIKLSVGDWPQFEERIRNRDRILPYIYISPYVDGKDEEAHCKYYVDPHKLAEKMFGNALVFYADDMDFTEEMRYMSPDYACYGGALRVYQPNTTEAARHRYMSRDDLVLLGEETVIKSLIRAFAQNVKFYESFLRMEQCQKLRTDLQRKKRLEELNRQHQAQMNEVESQKLDEAIEEERKRLEAEEWAEDLSQTVDEQKRRIWNLETQVDALNIYATENAGMKKSLESREHIDKMPSSRDDVVRYFQQVFADRLDFSASAIKSLKGCTLAPGVLWEFFYALATVMWPLLDSGNGDAYAQFRNKTGYDCARGEGAETRKDKKLMRQYQIDFNGEPIDIEPHLTFPAEGQSIHFGYSKNLRKIIIAHCGEHLDNYTTRKVH